MEIILPLHIATVALSAMMFVVNFFLMVKKSPYFEHSGVVKASRIIDLLAIMMISLVCMVSGRVPFVDSLMTEKLIAVVAYAALVIMALHHGKNMFLRSFAFAGGLGWLYYAYTLAVSGQAYLLR